METPPQAWGKPDNLVQDHVELIAENGRLRERNAELESALAGVTKSLDEIIRKYPLHGAIVAGCNSVGNQLIEAKAALNKKGE